jgi:hypothetical protein
MGIEPMTPVLPRLCATAAPHGPTLPYSYICLVPSKMSTCCHFSSLRTYVEVGSGGFEPPKLSQLIYSQSHLSTLVTAQVEEHTSSF